MNNLAISQAGKLVPIDACHAPSWACSLLAGLGMAGPTSNQSIRFHADGLEAQSARLAVVDGAQHRVLLSTCILGADDFGDALVAAVARRARPGVEVCVLLDTLARLRCGRPQLQTMRAAGITVRWVAAMCRNPNTQIHLRHHRKLVVCDGTAFWCGGRNFAAEYFTNDDRNEAWEDPSVDIRGPAAFQAELLFKRDWDGVGGTQAGAELDAVEAPGFARAPSFDPDQSADLWRRRHCP